MTAAAEHSDTLRRTGSAVLALGASELLGKVATFLMFLVMARLLAVAEFGVLSFGLSIGLLLAVLSSLGLDSRVVQLGSAQPDLLDRCYGALVAIRTVLAAAVMAMTAVVLFATMSTAHATAVSLLVASCLLDTLCDASRAACGARQRQQLSAVVLVVQRFSVLALAAAALVATRSAEYAALGYLVGTCIGVVGMHIAARRVGAHPQIRGCRPQARMVLEAAPVMGLGAVAAMGVFRIDAALIGIILGTTAVGVYGAGYRIFESILFVSWTLSRAYMPVIASRPDDRQHVRAWAQRALVVVCAIYLPYGVVIALRGDDLVGLLFGPAYVHPGVLLALAAAPLLFGVTHLASSVLLALRPDPVVLVASVIALVTNVALNLWLIPIWGITAAALATSFAFLVQSVILMGALSRITGSIVSVSALAAVVIASACAGVVAEAIGSVALALAGSAITYLVIWVATTRLLDPGGFAAFRSMVSRSRSLA
jgi:O-antigen/teichoic acid export membrane protein